MSRLTQRIPTYNPSPSPIHFPPSGPSSGRTIPSQRAQYSESPYGGGMASNGAGYTRATHDIEGQNDERLEGLLGKVKILKDITTGIGKEVQDSNMTLSGMNDAFASTSTFLGGTFKRMNNMAKRQGGNWCWFMGFLLLVLWIFVIVWWLRR